MSTRSCSLAKRSSSAPRAISPGRSWETISQRAPAAGSPASRARSTAASVWPGRSSTPPGWASSGTTCPGRTKSVATESGEARAAIVARAGSRRDAGAGAAQVHRHPVGRLEPVFAPVVHRRKIQPVARVARQGHAQEPGRVPDGEGHELRGGPGRGEDQVTFVLAVGVVDDHDGLTGRHGSDGLADPMLDGDRGRRDPQRSPSRTDRRPGAGMRLPRRGGSGTRRPDANPAQRRPNCSKIGRFHAIVGGCRSASDGSATSDRGSGSPRAGAQVQRASQLAIMRAECPRREHSDARLPCDRPSNALHGAVEFLRTTQQGS